MEVFLFMSSEDETQLMEQTLIAWERIEYAFPVNVVQLPQHRFEIKRRVTADKMASDSHYVLADIGCVPEEGRSLLGIMGKIQSKDGLIGLSEAGNSVLIAPGGVRVCRKGIVQKWPAPETNNYDMEHAAAVRRAGYEVGIWPITFKRILAC